MDYKEAYDWLVHQEDWTDKDICEVLNSEGSGAIIEIAEKLTDECARNE